MKATIMYRAGDVRVENLPDANLVNSTDALVRITRACICGSDLWPYKDLPPTPKGRPMGHEAIGVVEAVGADVRKVKKGDFVVMPFACSDGTCEFCHDGLQTACVHVGFFGYSEGIGGAQAEAIRVPLADGTLYALPVREDHALLPSLLTLSDVMGTGHHAAVIARVSQGKKAAVVGDGAVGLCWRHCRKATGNALRRRRQSLGLTAKDLATRANVTEGAVSHIERGIRKPSAEMIARLASVLDCSVDELLAGIAPQAKQGECIDRVLNAMKSFPPPIQQQVAEYCDFLRQQLRKKSRPSH